MATGIRVMGHVKQPGRQDRHGAAVDSISDAPDDLLVRRARTGDERAFEALYARHGPAIQAFIAHRVDGDIATAEDITSDVFTKVFRFLDRYEADSFRGWLYQVARNAVIDHYRRQRPVTTLDGEAELVSSAIPLDDLAVAQEARSNLLLALATLTPIPRRILELRLKGYGLNDICADLGMELSAVKSAQHRAFRKLRIELGETMSDRGDPA
jgi:RNA polymerase sigma-70 factor (ECF subfamily)